MNDAGPEPLIRARGVAIRFGARSILEDVDCAVAPGEIVTLIGPNGAGKTTLVRVLLGLLRPGRGSVERRRGLSIGYVPQRMSIEPTLPLSVAGFLALGRRSTRAAYRAALDEVGVARLLDVPVQQISGGEFQRVMLARALLREPDLLVLDEPAHGRDRPRAVHQPPCLLHGRAGCGLGPS